MESGREFIREFRNAKAAIRRGQPGIGELVQRLPRARGLARAPDLVILPLVRRRFPVLEIAAGVAVQAK
jgi:hypothetical protein